MKRLSRFLPLSLEGWYVFVLALSTFVGIWYGFPSLDVIKDTSGFSGGVLRAMEGHTLIPLANQLPYGIVTFYLCYAVIGAYLLIAIPFFHFSKAALEMFLLNVPQVIYALARATSAATVAAMVWYSYRFLRSEVEELWYRATILITVFGNILVAAISRSGKVWVISSVLGLAAVMFCYRSLRDEAGHDQLPGWNAFLTLVAISLTIANFALFSVYGIVLPVLVLGFRGLKGAWYRLALFTLVAAAIGILLMVANFQNTIGLFQQIFTGYHPLGTSIQIARPPFGESLWFHILQMLAVYPLSIALVVIALWYGIRDKKLFYLTATLMLLYFIAISFVANWYTDIYHYLRYLYPLGFLFLPLLAGLRAPPKWLLVFLFTANIAVYIFTIALMAQPTTYAVAAQEISDRGQGSEITMDDRVFELDLPMNKASYTLLSGANCSTKCQNALVAPSDIAFRPTVVTVYSSEPTSSLPDVLITDVPIAACGHPTISVTDGTQNGYFDVEYALGLYSDPAFYTIDRLGEPIYAYDEATCTVVPSRSVDANKDIGDISQP